MIGIIDADLIGRTKHRFPNLSCMKISQYHKNNNQEVRLITNYDVDFQEFDQIFISKVFTDTPVPDYFLNQSNVTYGGTGFFYDKSPQLPDEIEHCFPDYSLYGEWVLNKEINLEYYKDYSIGFITRRCFRGCFFCVNKNFKKVDFHASINEFVDPKRKYICLLDDNFLGYPKWKNELQTLIDINKPFQFKQGLDLRLMTNEKAEMLSSSKYRGDFIFAFDNIDDKELIIKKLKLWRNHTRKNTKLYVFCGYSGDAKDVFDTFERVSILMQFGCLPYIMRHSNYENSKYRGTFINLARWCNQPNFYKKMSYREFCLAHGDNSSPVKYMKLLEDEFPQTSKYYDLRFEK